MQAKSSAAFLGAIGFYTSNLPGMRYSVQYRLDYTGVITACGFNLRPNYLNRGQNS